MGFLSDTTPKASAHENGTRRSCALQYHGQVCGSGWQGLCAGLRRRLKARLEDSDVATEIRDAINHTIETIEPCLQAEEAGTHRVEAVAWPGEVWSVRFLCGGCGTIAEAEGNIRGECR